MNKRYRVLFYTNARGDSPVDAFLDSIETRVRAKVLKWLELLEEKGPDLPRPYADVLSGPLRELRISFGHRQIRLLYFFWGKKMVVVTGGFFKKKRKIARKEIERAQSAMRDWLIRNGG